ncbi:MAG: LysM peptidoglycan-binding domain-containing protein, partial [Polyangiaceae bacterium]|nr:LysM peptidoglycan-binding domain-containing protein [Polyangiaceae bacterium]
MKPQRRFQTSFVLAIVALAPSAALAQDEPVGPTSPPGGEGPVMVPGPSTSTTVVSPAGPGPGEVDSYLPSSSRSTTDINQSKSEFDLNPSSAGTPALRGGKGGQYIGEGASVPQAHTVKRGDTLWGISGQYFKNPYNWPKLWAQNPQILNPHWIYPGDRLRLRVDEFGGPLRPKTVPESTVFLRNYGWVDDPEKDRWGELVGAPDDQMLLSYGDDSYIELDEDKHKNIKVELGQELQLYRPVRTLRGREADASGELVEVLGTVRVDRYNPKTRMIRAHIIEGIDVIERGVYVGPIARKFLIVPPTVNEKYLEARILTALYPHQFFGQHQVVFIDRGAKQGVKVGNRFIAVRRGDRWVETLDVAGPGAKIRAKTEDDRDGEIEDLKTDGPVEKYPNETFAELRVLETRDNTAMA